MFHICYQYYSVRCKVLSSDFSTLRKDFKVDCDYYYVKAARPVADGEMFTLSVRRSFMRRRALFSAPIRYACQFISFFQYIIIRVRHVTLRH